MKRSFVFVAAFLAPFVLSAQPSPTNPLVTAFKNSSTSYVNWLTAAFDSIPESKYSYKPTPAQLSIGYIAQHLENANYFLCALFSNQKYVMTAKDSLADTVKATWPKDTLSARLKASFTYCNDAFTKVTDAQLTDALPNGPPEAKRTILRARYVMGYVTDLADHWSQIAIYMRLNGMTPPSALPRKP
ncbi:MAG: DinB family protein [Gemmatimonadaceae bacterium]